MDTQDRKKREVQSRKSSDGTFELYVGQNGEGLQEISEEEVSFAEQLAPPEPEEDAKRGFPISPRVAAVAIGALVLVVGGVGLVSVISDGASNDDVFVGGELPIVDGFKPYGGSVARNAKAKKTKPRLRKKNTAALKKALDEEEKTDPGVEVPTNKNSETADAWPVGENENPTDSEVIIDETNDDSAEIDSDEAVAEANKNPTNAAARKTLTPSKTAGIHSLKPGVSRPMLNTKSGSYNAFKKPSLDVVKGIQGIREKSEEVEASESDESDE